MLPLLYLHGLSSSDFGPAWSSPRVAAVCRWHDHVLTAQWQHDAEAFTSAR